MLNGRSPVKRATPLLRSSSIRCARVPVKLQFCLVHTFVLNRDGDNTDLLHISEI
jgi:hypothetical protein